MSVPLTGQVALSAAAQQLSAAVSGVAFTIKAPSSNAANAMIGGAAITSTTGFVLAPGESVTYETHSQNGQNPYPLRISDFYALGSAGDVVTWLASP